MMIKKVMKSVSKPTCENVTRYDNCAQLSIQREQ